jgi:5,6-dimethylbenzimidazole synthase
VTTTPSDHPELAATAEGLGYREEFLQSLLAIPFGVRPLAWLCLGPVTYLQETPDLERHGWRSKRPLAAAVHEERYGVQPTT